MLRLPHEPAACCFGESRTGSDIMRKSLRRVLERLRAATNGTFGKRMDRARRAGRAAADAAGARVAAGNRVRTAIVSTYPPRACGIGTFAADLRATLLGVDGVDARRLRRGRQRAVAPAATRAALDDRAVRPRRLRADGADARAARRRRRAAAARVRDLRRPRRRVRALVRGGAGAAARRDAAHGALGADAASAGGAHRAVRAGRARDRDDGHGAAAARRVRRLRGGEDPRRAARRAVAAHGARRP